MFGFLLSDLLHIENWITNPVLWVAMGFQLWMLVDAIRREEWMWVLFILIFPVFNAILYFLLVYRAAGGMSTRGFELPGGWDRKRIKELQAQIHHLDKAHHHYELGNVYFQQGKLDKAEQSYRAALERDSEDIDIRAHLGQCLLRAGRPQEARPLLEQVCAEKPDHDYGHSMMAFAECLGKLGDTDAGIAAWRKVLDNHSYARARVQLAELLLAKGDSDGARAELQEVVNDAPHTSAFQRKRERVWVRKARRLLGTISN